jgi:hypothetical protein
MLMAFVSLLFFYFVCALMIEGAIKTIDRILRAIGGLFPKLYITEKNRLEIAKLLSIAFSVALVFVVNINALDIAAGGILTAVDIEGVVVHTGVIGMLLTGLAIGRGSNWISQLMERLTKMVPPGQTAPRA